LIQKAIKFDRAILKSKNYNNRPLIILLLSNILNIFKFLQQFIP